ncbi:MAG: hypothetical protein C4334_10075 [Pyrinomonas sp.]
MKGQRVRFWTGDEKPLIVIGQEPTMNQRTKIKKRVIVARIRRAQVLYGAAFVLFATLALLAHLYAHFAWDVAATRLIQSFDQPWLLAVMRAVSVAGDGWIPYALTGTTAAVLAAMKLKREAAHLVLSAAGGAILNNAIKLLIARPRPDANLVKVFGSLDSKSFPSGHVMFYVAYFGFLFFVAYALLPRATSVRLLALALAALPVLLIGLSRVYLGLHWPSDVLGAYLISGLWLPLVLHSYRRFKEDALASVDRRT